MEGGKARQGAQGGGQGLLSSTLIGYNFAHQGECKLDCDWA